MLTQQGDLHSNLFLVLEGALAVLQQIVGGRKDTEEVCIERDALMSLEWNAYFTQCITSNFRELQKMLESLYCRIFVLHI